MYIVTGSGEIGVEVSTEKKRTKRSAPTWTMMGLLDLWFLLLCLGSSQCGSQSTIGVTTLAEKVTATSDHCIVESNNSRIIKGIGAIWVSKQDPCTIHTCELDETGTPVETIVKEDCSEVYCDVDSELRQKNGTCCGVCVRTKCRFAQKAYSIGQIWHNEQDCTLLECTQLPDGQPAINAYQKNCPPVPGDCPSDNLVVHECCQYCNRGTVGATRINFIEQEDVWTEEFYRKHPCVRDCRLNELPKTCYYHFVVEWYETLSKACFSCPSNFTDCERPHCVFGDGIPRSITVVNRMMPGPAIEVCQNDIIVVDVRNGLLGESTTIHWHGMHQRSSPYMDGAPHITQCPISPHSTFRYRFRAENVGTHFWHSHTGMQRGDGVFGALIVRQPRSSDPHARLYDFDLSDHKMIVQDWVHVPGISMFASHHHSRGDNKPRNLLINGRGRYYKAIWDSLKSQQKFADKDAKSYERDDKITRPTAAESATKPHGPTSTVLLNRSPQSVSGLAPKTLHGNVVVLHPLGGARGGYIRNALNQTSGEQISATASKSATGELKPKHTSPQPPIKLSGIEDIEFSPEVTRPFQNFSRQKRSTTDRQSHLNMIPLQTYTVRRGFRYRFRVINAEFLNCPITISIDNHTLTVISSDGYDFEAVDVASLVTYAGERFDFVVSADQPVANYWVRLKGLMDCSEKFTSAFQVAVLRYEGAPAEEPHAELGYHHKAEGIELNAMNRGSGHVDSLTIAELNSMPYYDKVPGVGRASLRPVADYKFFVYYDFYRKDNPIFHPSDYYGIDANLSDSNRLFTPQLNHISLKFPSVALLPSRWDVDDALFCNETSLEAGGIDCRTEFCYCHHVLQVPLNAVVEFIIVDEGFTYDANHPFHLHGNAFRVVGLERLGANVTIEMVKDLDRLNLLKRNLVQPPVKDTVTVPDGGYTIVRFEAYNPGFWLFHCHIEFHAEIGMALVLKVGDNREMPSTPHNFPTCYDYIPDKSSEELVTESGPQSTAFTTSTYSGGDVNSPRRILFNLLLLLCILNGVIV